MHILLVSPGWPPEHFANGIVTSLAQFRQAYQRLGHTPHIVTNEIVGDGCESGVHGFQARPGIVRRMVGSVSWRLGVSHRVVSPTLVALRHKIAELHDAGMADILEMEETWGHARHLIGRVPVPVVVRLHGPWFLNGRANGAEMTQGSNYRLRVSLEGKAILKADGVTAPSNSVLNETRRQYGASLPDAAVVPNPMQFGDENELWSDAACEKDTILFVGRFDRHKGGDVVLSAFREVARCHSTARLLFCGPDRGFTDNDGITYCMAEYMDRLSLPSDARSRVEVLGQQPARQVAALRRRAAVTVLASRYENFAGVLLEAASLGCPVVGTDSGGTPEIIEDGETGLLVPAEDADGLAKAILRLLTDRALAVRLGRAGWEAGRREFDPDTLAARTVRFYESVIELWNVRHGMSRND